MVFALLAVTLYSLPIVVLWGTRARRDRAIGEFALDIPLAVAIDLLATLLLARVTLLWSATVVVRIGWLVYGAGCLLWRHRRGHSPRWPDSIDWQVGGNAVAAGAACTWLSLLFSRRFTIWDRDWHIPLVSSLRGQTIPFHNIYQPDTVLHYHFAGDVIAAQLQTLSGGILNASNALSLAHDLMFGLTGLSFALLLQMFGARHAASAVGGALALLLTGPFTLRPENQAYHGYSYLSYLHMSFRPHVSVAGLFLVGCVGSIAVGGRPDARGAPWARTLVPLTLSGSALSIADEASFALVAVSAGAVWLLRPGALHGRLAGFVCLVTLAAGALLANLLFAASLSPGGPVQQLTVVHGVLPGYSQPPLPLTEAAARAILFFDFLPTLAALLAILWAAPAGIVRGPTGSVVFALAIVSGGLLGLTTLAIKSAPWEAHRFATAPTFAVPMLSMLALASVPRGTVPTALLQLGLFGSSASTIAWTWMGLPSSGIPNASYGPHDLYEADCRAETEAHLGERATRQYIEDSIWFLWSGCHPTFSPGQRTVQWSLKTNGPAHGLPALRELDEQAGAAPMMVVCAVKSGNTDPVCAFAASHGLCSASGASARRCELVASDRRLILAH
jgi:hypothetical protein